jgi:hypothetical protein
MSVDGYCKNCQFRSDDELPGGYQCRRYPPSVQTDVLGGATDGMQGLKINSQTYSVWPMVTTDDWCGEWVKAS